MEIQAEAIEQPDLLPATPGVPYNPPGQSQVTNTCWHRYFSSENKRTDAPFADNPYL